MRAFSEERLGNFCPSAINAPRCWERRKQITINVNDYELTSARGIIYTSNELMFFPQEKNMSTILYTYWILE
jgi:hypothetical protein